MKRDTHRILCCVSHGLNLCVCEICDTCISDHSPVLFTVTLLSGGLLFYLLMALRLSSAFNYSVLPSLCNFCNISAEEITSLFNSTCRDILDLIAPFTTRRPQSVTEPWLNDTTHTLRRTCRWVERKWKKDRLHVS